MSLVHSISIDSTSSAGTMTAIPTIDLAKTSSNGLYDDGDHFQAIFSNDSRFFDTSLHLFKSYCTLGYIQSNDEQYKNNLLSTLTTTSNEHKHRWKPRLLGLNNNNNNNNHNHNGVLKAFLTPTLLKKHNHPTSIRSDSVIPSNEPINLQQQSQMIVHYQRPSVSNTNILDDDKSDEPEIIITRL